MCFSSVGDRICTASLPLVSPESLLQQNALVIMRIDAPALPNMLLDNMFNISGETKTHWGHICTAPLTRIDTYVLRSQTLLLPYKRESNKRRSTAIFSDGLPSTGKNKLLCKHVCWKPYVPSVSAENFCRFSSVWFDTGRPFRVALLSSLAVKTFCSQNTNLSHRREKSNETSLAENIFYHYIVMAYLLKTKSSWSLLSGFGCCSGYQTKFCLSLTLPHAFTLTVWSALPLLVTSALPFHFASSSLLAGVRQVREGL